MVISFDSRYKFTGKERDEETDYDYFGARYYDSDLSQWLSVDPMSDKYPSLSAYNYCAGNPVRLIDPDGNDWYEDENGKAVFSENIHSQKELKDAGINGKYIGITGYTNDKSQYLSLFGSKINTKTADGKTNLMAEMIKNIDNAIINSYKADFLNNNNSNFDSEVHSSATDMSISMKVAPSQVYQGDNIFEFNYAGGKVHYRVTNNMSGGVFDWGDGKIRLISGYFVSIGTGANATIERNNANFRIVDWIFPTTNAWQNTKSKADVLLKNRKW